MADGPDKWRPQTHETADHSIPYSAGLALMYGKIDPEYYEDPYLHDPRLLVRQNLGYGIVLIVFIAAVITPSGDPYSLAALAIPMYIFYEASILIGMVIARRKARVAARAEAAVFRPRGNDAFEFLGKIPKAEWKGK